MDAVALHTGAATLQWEYNTGFISVIEAKGVILEVKHIDHPVCFLQEQFDNDLFLPKYEKSSVMPADMCTKPCSCQLIGWSTKYITGFRFYPTSEIGNYQFIILH